MQNFTWNFRNQSKFNFTWNIRPMYKDNKISSVNPSGNQVYHIKGIQTISLNNVLFCF